MPENCKKCKHLKALFERTPKSDRDYWNMTELFVLLHGGDVCNKQIKRFILNVKEIRKTFVAIEKELTKDLSPLIDAIRRANEEIEKIEKK